MAYMVLGGPDPRIEIASGRWSPPDDRHHASTKSLDEKNVSVLGSTASRDSIFRFILISCSRSNHKIRYLFPPDATGARRRLDARPSLAQPGMASMSRPERTLIQREIQSVIDGPC